MSPERHATLSLARHGAQLLTLSVLVLAGASADADEHARVRTNDIDIRQAIADAYRRSPTFRTLVDTIDQSDGLVYVERGRCGHGVRACLALSITVAGPNRILRIRVDGSRVGTAFVASLGHELRHATELLGDARVTSTPAMFFYYANRGASVNGVFETDAAIAAGEAVRAEFERAAHAPRADTALAMAGPAVP